MNFKHQFKQLLILSLSLFVASCGWQLRGYHSADLAIGSISVDQEKINNPIFTKVFRDIFANEYQVSIDANAEIKTSVTSIREQKRVSSKDRDGDVTEYEHTITLSMQTQLPNAEEALNQSFISIRRQSYNEDNLLSSDLQERSTKVEAYRELSRQYASYLARQLSK